MEVIAIFDVIYLRKKQKRWQMETQTIYIYLIRGGTVVQDECACEEYRGGRYRFQDKKRNFQTIGKSQLDVCERNRVVSFTDDLPRFREMIIADLEKRIEVTRIRLKQQEDTLQSIKENM